MTEVPGEIRAVLVVRDEMLRLPHLLDWHRALGVGRFLAIDNGSTDGTAAFLLAQPDVHLFHSPDSFAATGCGSVWINGILDAYCDGHWTLAVDADELFVYPGYETVKLDRLTAWLDAAGAEAVFATLVDMYPAGPIREAHLLPGQRFLSVCPYFDPGPYDELAARTFPHRELYGGPRARVFWAAGTRRVLPPTVSKVPFVRWRRGHRLLPGQHGMNPVALAEIVGALLHFKFFADFHDRALREAARGEHHDGGREYREYAAMLAADPALGLMYPGSLAYEGSAQLVASALMRDSPGYRRFVAGQVLS